MMKIQSKDFILYLFSAIGFIFVAYILIGGFLKQSSLRRNGKEIDAVIERFHEGSRGWNSIYYYYFINEVKYQGGGMYYPKSDTLSIGDTIIVIYDKTNFSSSKPERDF